MACDEHPICTAGFYCRTQFATATSTSRGRPGECYGGWFGNLDHVWWDVCWCSAKVPPISWIIMEPNICFFTLRYFECLSCGLVRCVQICWVGHRTCPCLVVVLSHEKYQQAANYSMVDTYLNPRSHSMRSLQFSSATDSNFRTISCTLHAATPRFYGQDFYRHLRWQEK